MNPLIQLAILFKATSGIEGRKKLQKMVHILQEFSVPFGMTFGYHHYGPFSDDLQDRIEAMKFDGLIVENLITGKQYPTSKFVPSPRMEGLISLAGELSSYRWTEFAVELNKRKPQVLEAISTLLYLEGQASGIRGEEEVNDTFKVLKPHLAKVVPTARTLLMEYRERFAQGSVGTSGKQLN